MTDAPVGTWRIYGTIDEDGEASVTGYKFSLVTPDGTRLATSELDPAIAAQVAALAGSLQLVISTGDVPAGPSAFEVAQAAGFVGDVNDWLDSLVGADGADGQGFTFTGAWTDATGYDPYDLASRAGSTYICTVGHTSATATAPGTGADWEDVWAVVAQAGTNGTNGTNGADGADGAHATVFGIIPTIYSTSSTTWPSKAAALAAMGIPGWDGAINWDGAAHMTLADYTPSDEDADGDRLTVRSA